MACLWYFAGGGLIGLRKMNDFKHIASILRGFKKTARPTLFRKSTILEYCLISTVFTLSIKSSISTEYEIWPTQIRSEHALYRETSQRPFWKYKRGRYFTNDRVRKSTRSVTPWPSPKLWIHGPSIAPFLNQCTLTSTVETVPFTVHWAVALWAFPSQTSPKKCAS
jgi:hypothetical protein